MDELQKRRPGAPKGNRNAFKTGLHTAEMIELRRRMRHFQRTAKAVMKKARADARAARAKSVGAVPGETPPP